MDKNKRGLSAIVITLILILLSLVAVGIVWVVVNNVIKGGAEGIDIGAKCMNVDVSATDVSCVAGICDVDLERTGIETDAIAGVKMVLSNVSAGESTSIIDAPGNIELLVGTTVTGVDTTGEMTEGPDRIEVTVYFEDESGEEKLCSKTSYYEF